MISILVGEEPYLIEKEIDLRMKPILASGFSDFNLDRFSARDTPIDRILDACQMLPMMGEERLVLVRDVEAFKKEALEILAKYFEKPSPTTNLVLVATKIDKRLKGWAGASKKGWIKELKAPYLNQVPSWLAGEARQLGITLGVGAAQALVDLMGNNLKALGIALAQLEIFVSPTKKIEAAHVQELMGGFSSQTVFDFANLVGKGNLAQASRLLDELVALGEPLVRLFGLLSRHFRQLKLAQEGCSQRLGEAEMASLLKVHPFFVKDYLVQARGLSPSRLNAIYEDLLPTDRLLKSSRLEARLVLDRFLLKACTA